MSHVKECPRCGERSFEVMSTYAHCPSCFYVEDYWQDSETSYYDALKQAERYVAEWEEEDRDELAEEEEMESVA